MPLWPRNSEPVITAVPPLTEVAYIPYTPSSNTEPVTARSMTLRSSGSRQLTSTCTPKNSVCRWESVMIRSRLPSFRYRNMPAPRFSPVTLFRAMASTRPVLVALRTSKCRAVPVMLTKFASSMAATTSSSE